MKLCFPKKNILFFCAFFFHLNVSATLLPFPSPLPKVDTPYDSILLKTWQGIKKRNVDLFEIKMIHRPYSESPGDAVSEGVGYGMILALYCNDQEYFNMIWDAGETYLYDSENNRYNWRIHPDKRVEPGAATDAEEDIALCLIFADQLVKKNVWTQHTSPKGATYAQRANILINNIWNSMVEDGRYLKPGDSWGGKNLLNPGYFAPAFYRVFDEFEEQDHNWKGLIDECYNIITKSEGYSKGLIPDFTNSEGKPVAAGYNTYAESKHLYKDAIRIYWRLGTDFLWYGDPRAKAFLKNAVDFIESPQNANFFQMDGNVVPETDSFTLGNDVKRPRAEHSHLTIGMWACAAIAVGDAKLAQLFSDELLKYYEPGADYWGKSSDPNNEDTLHNEMYFDQFLAWFGASMLSGVFTNLWEDLKDPDPFTPLAWKVEPIFSTRDLNASIAPFTVNGIFNKYARWNVELVHIDSSDSRIFSGAGETLFVSWNGLNSNGAVMKQGWYNVNVSARALSKPIHYKVWLGKSFDLMENNRLIIDDFRDDDLNPFIGNVWQSYLDSHEGKTGKSSVKEFTVKTMDNKKWIVWSYHLDQGNLGFDPYAALEWNCTTPDGNLDLTGIDTLILNAKSSTPLAISVQIITSDIGDYNYHEDSLYLTATATEYKLPISGFRPRFGGENQLNLSKTTAIRFQVQLPSGNENSIMLSKFYVTGNLEKIYTAPPEYIPMSVKPSKNQKNFPLKITWFSTAGGLLFSIPKDIKCHSITVFDITGKVIAQTRVNRKVAFIPVSGKMANRVCLAKIKMENGTLIIPLAMIR